MPSRRARTNTSAALVRAGMSISVRPSTTAEPESSSGPTIQLAAASWIQPSGGWSYQYV
jgi:hypothetical protein